MSKHTCMLVMMHVHMLIQITVQHNQSAWCFIIIYKLLQDERRETSNIMTPIAILRLYYVKNVT